MRSVLCIVCGVAVGAMATGVGFWIGQQQHREAPARVLRAATASNNDSFAMATGRIDEDVEGLFTLDFLTGDLQCTVINYRTAKLSAVYKANVLRDLGVDQEKEPQYLLATGSVNFPRGGTIARPALSVVYVLDTVTGNFAAYGLPWRRELAAAGRPQGGLLQLLDVGRARTAALRE